MFAADEPGPPIVGLQWHGFGVRVRCSVGLLEAVRFPRVTLTASIPGDRCLLPLTDCRRHAWKERCLLVKSNWL
jgi:hypothetical protein